MNGLIEIGDKVVLYGFFNGFTYETDGATNGLVALETGERVEIPLGGIMKKDQIITKKDVISRMKQLFPNNRIDWINGILHEFGDEFGLWKYKAGYEQGKLEGAIKREKLVVPQFVADYIKDAKYYEWDLDDVFDHIAEESEGSEISEWFYTLGNVDVFARAWLDGYEVEKEPKYTVKFKATKQYLSNDELGPHFDPSFRSNFTKSDLEKLGLAEVFNSPLFEVEEV